MFLNGVFFSYIFFFILHPFFFFRDCLDPHLTAPLLTIASNSPLRLLYLTLVVRSYFLCYPLFLLFHSYTLPSFCLGVGCDVLSPSSFGWALDSRPGAFSTSGTSCSSPPGNERLKKEDSHKESSSESRHPSCPSLSGKLFSDRENPPLLPFSKGGETPPKGSHSNWSSNWSYPRHFPIGPLLACAVLT